MNAHELHNCSMIALSDLLSDEVVSGWAVPREHLSSFVQAVEAAARASGAVPFSQIDFLEFDNAITSLMGVSLSDPGSSIIQEAESIVAAVSV